MRDQPTLAVEAWVVGVAELVDVAGELEAGVVTRVDNVVIFLEFTGKVKFFSNITLPLLEQKIQ